MDKEIIVDGGSDRAELSETIYYGYFACWKLRHLRRSTADQSSANQDFGPTRFRKSSEFSERGPGSLE